MHRNSYELLDFVMNHSLVASNQKHVDNIVQSKLKIEKQRKKIDQAISSPRVIRYHKCGAIECQ